MWVLGGRVLDGGARLDDVWAYDLDEASWCRLDSDARPALGRVLASTYSAPQDVLWVLDVVRRRHHRSRVRLLRLDPVTAAGEVVASWPRLAWPRNNRFVMSVDPAGTLYLGAWRRRGPWHVVVRLGWDASRGVAVLGWRIGAGRILGPTLRASDEGVSFRVERGRRSRRRVEAVAYPVRQLWSVPGGARACF